MLQSVRTGYPSGQLPSICIRGADHANLSILNIKSSRVPNNFKIMENSIGFKSDNWNFFFFVEHAHLCVVTNNILHKEEVVDLRFIVTQGKRARASWHVS
jgi:hypothetical protein